jgi:hypothetical protein
MAIREQRLDNWTAARALALVNFAMTDGFIAGFEARYRHRFWRPETALRAAVNGKGKGPTKSHPEWKGQTLLRNGTKTGFQVATTGTRSRSVRHRQHPRHLRRPWSRC